VGILTHLAWGEKPLEVGQENPKPAAADPQEAKAPAPPPVAADENFETAPGYAWAIAPPQRSGPGYAWAIGWGPPPQKGLPAEAGIAAIEEKDKDGGLVITLAHPPSTNRALPDYRPVAFDAARKRYPLKATVGVGTATATLQRYYLDPKVLPAEKVTHLGIEVLTPEGPKAIARRAAERAKQEGVEVLPFPQIGEGYEFVLTTLGGQKVRTRDFRGKVVLIDCWATWCSPCMAKMPTLKALYEKRQKDGLEIVGVSFDQDAEKARKAIQSQGLTWPQVLVPADDQTRELWREASGIGALPRLLLLDRDGVLRADCYPGELEEQIARLLAQKPQAVKP
jgi:thiol-disulfide isomerase/thioredoxin